MPPTAPDPANQLVIVAGEQADGVTFQIHPVSRARIQKLFPNARTSRSLFVGSDTHTDYTDIHGPMWTQIVLLLTGLSHNQLSELGSTVIYFPTTGAQLSPEIPADQPDQLSAQA